MLFLAVSTRGGVFLQLPRRGRSNKIQNNAIEKMATAAPTTGTLER